MAGADRKKSSKATGKAKKAAIKATREIKQNRREEEDRREAGAEQAR
ncbi:hypothetical protein Sme01_46410 [Sphaerisporangium melleum]|uniref:Uncharacterized protein n=1 Tax=Sphaerisporangium melleum TaxID=321316 RepID=A0A917VNG7_9ACTN|nr:hypothetical protein [Sphaerisporangium melleum]GGL01783.1 hypothetical protein GCM10007964_49820 [Sphaerisporangium melleum]GII72165.1 hypothetical protein Sme01_46410 [Sphaerisporangium melleum]